MKGTDIFTPIGEAIKKTSKAIGMTMEQLFGIIGNITISLKVCKRCLCCMTLCKDQQYYVWHTLHMLRTLILTSDLPMQAHVECSVRQLFRFTKCI